MIWLTEHTPKTDMTSRTTTPMEIETSFISGKRVLLDESQATLPSNKRLSACEKEFLKRLAQGDSYKEIAAGMDVSINTVRDYVRAVYKKWTSIHEPRQW